MQILSFNFFLYTIGGLWRPIEWSSKCSKLLYSLFTCFSLYLLIFLMLTQLLNIIIAIDNIDDFTINSSLLFSIFSVLFKAAAVVIHRDGIVNLIETLQKKPCIAYNEEENDIQIKFDDLIKTYSKSYTYIASVSATCGVIGGTAKMLKGEFPFRTWVPYDYSSPIIFLITSIQEIVAMIIGTIVNVATETTVLGFCLQICAQIEILKHRLRRMVKVSKGTPRILLNDASNKTSRLSELAKIINAIFNQVIFVQFFISILVLCTSMYYLSSHITVADISYMGIYVLCMFMQIFIYCWAGNEVIIKVAEKSTELGEAVYQMDWILMPINEQRDLLMIMKRSAKPIKLTSSFLVTLSLDSYANLLKASYSVFNILQQS